MNLFRYFAQLPKGSVGWVIVCALLFIVVFYPDYTKAKLMWKSLIESTTVTTSKHENDDRLNKSSGNLHPGSDDISYVDSNEYKEEMPYTRKILIQKTNTTQDEDLKRNEASGNTKKTRTYNTVDLRENDHGDCRVVPLNTDPPIKICIHSNVKVDKHVSGCIARGKMWEDGIVKYMQRALAKQPTIVFLVIGSNIGEFALVSAKMNHSVVAVEALTLHANMLRRSAHINSLEDKIIVINNAVSNTRRTIQMKALPGNIGITYVAEIGPWQTKLWAHLIIHQGLSCKVSLLMIVWT